MNKTLGTLAALGAAGFVIWSGSLAAFVASVAVQIAPLFAVLGK